jgi:hypothetical protein
MNPMFLKYLYFMAKSAFYSRIPNFLIFSPVIFNEESVLVYFFCTKK